MDHLERGMLMSNDQRRLYRLSPWLIRALIPPCCVGAYQLFQIQQAFVELMYIGRSDTCLRQRLIYHAYQKKAVFFDFDVVLSPEKAFLVESALFHTARSQLTNVIHPARPRWSTLQCPFCWKSLESAQQNRMNQRGRSSR